MQFHPLLPALLFTASKDESIRLWNVVSGVCVAVMAGDLGHRDEVLSLVGVCVYVLWLCEQLGLSLSLSSVCVSVCTCVRLCV